VVKKLIKKKITRLEVLKFAFISAIITFGFYLSSVKYNLLTHMRLITEFVFMKIEYIEIWGLMFILTWLLLIAIFYPECCDPYGDC